MEAEEALIEEEDVEAGAEMEAEEVALAAEEDSEEGVVAVVDLEGEEAGEAMTRAPLNRSSLPALLLMLVRARLSASSPTI